jgi:hypothetical protein
VHVHFHGERPVCGLSPAHGPVHTGWSTTHSCSLTELPIGPDLAGFAARLAARPYPHKVDSMATPCCDCDRTFLLPQDPYGPPTQCFEARSSIAVRTLGPLVGAIGVLWSPVLHAAGFSYRGAVAMLCAAGAMRLARRLRRTRYRWDLPPAGPGRHRRGAW